MSFSLSSVGHAFARAGKEIVHEAKVIAALIAKIDTPEVKAGVETATKMLLPGNTIAIQVEDLAFAALGKVFQLASDTGNVQGHATLLQLGFDQTEVNDIVDLAKTVAAAKASIIANAPAK